MTAQSNPIELDTVIARAVESGAVPNLVVTVADRSGSVYRGAAGPRNVETDPTPVGPDTVFWIASMTKMVTTVAALQLRERGLLDFAAPVAAYRPEWDELQVLEGFDGDAPRLRAPRTTATVANLLTHTAGLTYWFYHPDMVRYEELTGQVNVVSGELRALRAPLVAEPGSRFEYGTSTDWLGLVVEAVSGQPLDSYATEHVTGPLGMVDTAFAPDESQLARLAAVHANAGDGWFDLGMELVAEPEYWSGGHGLYSTPRDYERFLRMLLAGGSLGGTQILTAESVADAFRDHLGGLTVPPYWTSHSELHAADLEVGENRTWGWGLLLNTVDQPGMRAAYSGGWYGLSNVHFWVDPGSGIAASIWLQALPFGFPTIMETFASVERAIYT